MYIYIYMNLYNIKLDRLDPISMRESDHRSKKISMVEQKPPRGSKLCEMDLSPWKALQSTGFPTLISATLSEFTRYARHLGLP